MTISNVAQKVQTIPNEVCFLDGREGDRIPCDFAFFPKNEEACQLSHRVARVVEYISDRCAVLLPRNIDKHIADLKKGFDSYSKILFNFAPVNYNVKINLYIIKPS